jgi:DNA-binding NarL/FixJ family response regulator
LIVDDHALFRALACTLLQVEGFEVSRRLAQAEDAPAIALVSSRDRSAYRRRLAESPASGFIAQGDLSGAAVGALVG